MYFDLAKELATGVGDAQEEEEEGSDDDSVYTDFYGGEDDDEDTGQPNEKFQRRDSPIGINLRWGSHEIGDGVNDDCGKAGVRDPEESVRQAIESDDDTDGSEDTSDRGPDTRFGLECRTREGTSSRVGTEAGSDCIGDTNCDQLLVGVDLITIQASKRWWIENVGSVESRIRKGTGTYILRWRCARAAE